MWSAWAREYWCKRKWERCARRWDAEGRAAAPRQNAQTGPMVQTHLVLPERQLSKHGRAHAGTASDTQHGRARQSSTAERWGRQGEVSPEGVARSLREVAGASLHKRSRQAAAHLVPALRSARTQAPRPRTCDDGHTKSSYCITVCINRPVFLFCFLTRGLQFNSVYKDELRLPGKASRTDGQDQDGGRGRHGGPHGRGLLCRVRHAIHGRPRVM